MGLADYGDGPDSSDAEPTAGRRREERRVPGSAPAGRISAGTPAGRARAADLEGIQESGVSRVEVGVEELSRAAKWGSLGAGSGGGTGIGGEGKEEAFGLEERALSGSSELS